MMEDDVTTDPTLSHEVKSLHKELAAARNSARPAATDDFRETAEPAPPPQADDQGAQTQAGEFVKAIAEFVAEAENNIATHPTANMLGALVVGILIGRLLARR